MSTNANEGSGAKDRVLRVDRGERRAPHVGKGGRAEEHRVLERWENEGGLPVESDDAVTPG